MRALLLGKASVRASASLMQFLEIAPERGHSARLVDRHTFLGLDLAEINVVCLKSYYDSGKVWRKIKSSSARGVNSRESCELCADRTRLDALLNRHNVLTPRSASDAGAVQGLVFPIVQKLRQAVDRDNRIFSRPTAAIDCETYFYQEMVPHDGWVYKVYCIGDMVSVRLEHGGTTSASIDVASADPAASLPALSPIARHVGSITGLEVFGLDFVKNVGRFFLIDVNPFPSFRSLPRAAETLWKYLEGSSNENG